MENQIKQLVTEFLTAVKAFDLETVSNMLHPDVKWLQPGNNEISGLKESKDQVFTMVGKMLDLSGNTLKLTEFKHISENTNGVACQLQWTAQKASGDILNVSNIDVYTLKNGKITHVDIYTTDQAKEDAFWKS